MSKLLGLILGIMMIAGVSFAHDNHSPVRGGVGHHDHHHRVWHCIAYPRGSHHHGFSARDRHRSHARTKAMMRCERATGRHCHHIDCHVDHHHN